MNTLLDCLADADPGAIALQPVDADALERWRTGADAREAAWVAANGFDARAGRVCLLPSAHGGIARVLVGVDATPDPFALGDLPAGLPAGRYRLECDWGPDLAARAALGFALGAYRFERYRSFERARVELCVPDGVDAQALRAEAEAVYLTRDLINTPAEDMLPADLADAASDLAARIGADCEVIAGDALLEAGFPAIHAVGRASANAPRLVDLRWGDEAHPRVALVGKGVCFDSGGLDIKPAAGMRLMKKDMGGAAHVLGLLHLIASAALPVRVRVLVAAVENAISGNALRPGDVIRTRKGLSVEIDNTDAEGRVVLADALALAAEDEPELVVDFATLTGAARVSVGTEIAAMFANDDTLADGIARAGERIADPVWRLPLHAPYAKLIESKVADIANSGGSPYAGAITAALFLQRFVAAQAAWAHFDVMAWNARARPGRPEGAEAMGMRAVFEYLRERYPR